MKLASLRTASPDGQLVVVSGDASYFVAAEAIAPNMQDALDRWEATSTQLRDLYDRLNTTDLPEKRPYDPTPFTAPLQRAWQWLGASAFPTHGKLMQTGSCCISERRAIEILTRGSPVAPFMRFGDQVRISATMEEDSKSAFGEIHQRAVSISPFRE